MTLIAALGVGAGIVHAIFRGLDDEEQGWYMTKHAYCGPRTDHGPRRGCRTPEDFSAHGIMFPAPTDFDYWYQGIKEMIT